MGVDMRGLCPLIQVYDMPRSLRFYRDILGFEVMQRSQDSDECGWCWLRSKGGAELMLNTAYDEGERPLQPDRERTVGHMDTGLFIGCPDVDAAYEYLKEWGLVTQPPHVAPYGMKQLYIKDPDGFGICFQWKA
ncbi:MAG TPA: VOC family protein [Candidatus Koribacter sp.]|jgi:catechol 2,3-dioxygenase-like lactoylglutathione lyase family enzyme